MLLVLRPLTTPIDFHSRKKKRYYGGQWLTATVWLPTFFKIYFMFNRTKKTHAGLEQHEGE